MREKGTLEIRLGLGCGNLLYGVCLIGNQQRIELYLHHLFSALMLELSW